MELGLGQDERDKTDAREERLGERESGAARARSKQRGRRGRDREWMKGRDSARMDRTNGEVGGGRTDGRTVGRSAGQPGREGERPRKTSEPERERAQRRRATRPSPHRSVGSAPTRSQ